MKYKDKYLQEKDAKEYAQQSFENIRKQNVELLEQIERLQEQLNEANEVIKKTYDQTYNSEWSKLSNKLFEIAEKYLEKWGVK